MQCGAHSQNDGKERGFTTQFVLSGLLNVHRFGSCDRRILKSSIRPAPGERSILIVDLHTTDGFPEGIADRHDVALRGLVRLSMLFVTWADNVRVKRKNYGQVGQSRAVQASS